MVELIPLADLRGPAGSGGLALRKFRSPLDPYYGGPDALNVGGSGIDNYQTALANVFEHSQEEGGIVIIDQPFGAIDELTVGGGFEIWQTTPRKIPVTPMVEPGIIALDDAFRIRYGNGSDGSGSMNDNPGVVRGLVVDGNGIAGAEGLFIADAFQSSIYDLMVVGFTDIGFHMGRSQNMNLFNLQVEGPGTGVLFKPLVEGQQGTGHIIIVGGHIHDCTTPIQTKAWASAPGPIGYAHDIVFSKTLVETGRVAGRAVRCGALIESGLIKFDDVNFTFGAQVGGSTGNDVQEDCVILIDNPVYTGYSTVVDIAGGTLGGGANGVTDAIRIKQSGSANVLMLDSKVGWANVDNKICNDGVVLGGCDPLIIGSGGRVIAGTPNDIRCINNATKLNAHENKWMGIIYKLPAGATSAQMQGPLVVGHEDEPYNRLFMDYNGAFKYLDPLTGETIGTIIRPENDSTFGTTGRFGIGGGFYRPPTTVIVNVDKTVTFNWDICNYYILAFTANGADVTSSNFAPFVTGKTPKNGQRMLICVSVTAGVTPNTINWGGTGIVFNPAMGPIVPVPGLNQFIEVVWAAGVGWLEQYRSNPDLYISFDGSPEAQDVVFSPPAGMTSVDVQAAIVELKNTLNNFVDVNNVMTLKGVIDASTNPNYPAGDAGEVWVISVAGRIGGASGPKVEIGDRILCTTESSPAGNHATVGANWAIAQANIDGAVTGPASANAGYLPKFADSTGKTLVDSGIDPTALAPLSSPAFSGNPTVPDQAAGNNSGRAANTKYVDAKDSAALTYTNKRITPRVLLQTAVASTLTVDSDAYDRAALTAQNAPFTVAAPTGTPTSMQGLILRFKDDGTARAITWNAIFKAIGVVLPTTTVVGKTTYVGLLYNVSSSKWEAVAVTTEA